MGGAKMTRVITFRLSDEERRLIQKHADREKKSVTGYLRGCYLADMVMAGDVGAAKIVCRELGIRARAKFFKNMSPPDAVGSYLETQGV